MESGKFQLQFLVYKSIRRGLIGHKIDSVALRRTFLQEVVEDVFIQFLLAPIAKEVKTIRRRYNIDAQLRKSSSIELAVSLAKAYFKDASVQL